MRRCRDRWIGERRAFIGMNVLGASGLGPEIYKHSGIALEAVVAAAKGLV